jgi:protein tyrosine phosphatase (PTP) superfamily phosphohydrolase (DUF442 family)
MRDACCTVAGAIKSIRSLEELEGFTNMIRNAPDGVKTKQPTKLEWQEIADLKIQMQKGRSR